MHTGLFYLFPEQEKKPFFSSFGMFFFKFIFPQNGIFLATFLSMKVMMRLPQNEAKVLDKHDFKPIFVFTCAGKWQYST